MYCVNRSSIILHKILNTSKQFFRKYAAALDQSLQQHILKCKETKNWRRAIHLLRSNEVKLTIKDYEVTMEILSECDEKYTAERLMNEIQEKGLEITPIILQHILSLYCQRLHHIGVMDTLKKIPLNERSLVTYKRLLYYCNK